MRNLSMFLCAILMLEALSISVYAQEDRTVSESSGVIQEESMAALSGNSVSDNQPMDSIVLPKVRYDFCEIGYSEYAGETVKTDALATAYLSQQQERLDGTGISYQDQLYDPYISAADSVTPVRNQGSTDTCWAFATTATAELSSIKKGLTGAEQWFSPYDLSYFLYHHVTDPLGGTEGDTNTAVTSKNPDFLYGGGNLFMALFQLANWSGLVEEQKAPFEEWVEKGSVPPDSMAYDADVLLQNGYMITTGEHQVQDIKQAVVDYGGVAIQFCGDSKYKNAATGAYYCNVSGTNHAVVIVGWDDNYSVSNFNANYRPAGNGAWIVKNSWGNSQGREGYNYISYEDASIAYPVALEVMEKDTYDNNYHYDGSLAVTDASVVAVKSGGSVANIFTAKASPEGWDESLEAVSIALKSTDVSYKISVYKNLEENENGTLNPSSGNLMLTQEGKTGRAGIYTIPLKQSICLSSEDTFSVVFTLQSEDAAEIEVWMEKDYDYGWVKGTANIQKGQSFRKLASNYTWFDLYYTNSSKPYRGLARIKAFTNTLSNMSDNDICHYQITVSENSFVADGTAKCPPVTVMKGKKVLIQGTDYKVAYRNNLEAGKGSIVITGIGKYIGEMTLPIYLYQYPVTECPEHVFEDGTCVYCGYALKEQKLEGTTSYVKNFLDDAFRLEVSGNQTPLQYESDNPAVVTVNEEGLVAIKGIGNANIIVTAVESSGYQKACMQVQVQVEKAPIGVVQLSDSSFYYDGTAKCPSVKVLNQKGTLLRENQDYTVQYSNNKEIGTANVLVTGMGNYTGIAKKTFTIARIPQEQCSHLYENGTCKYCGYNRKIQNLTGTWSYERLFSDGNFWLDTATQGDGRLTYLSDDPSVVTVDDKGYVTVHGVGIAYIYVTAEESSCYYSNTAQVLVEILPGKPSISVPDSAIKKTYGSKSFSLKVTTDSDGKKTYQTGNKKVATISSKGKVTIKGYGKTTLSITTAETDLYEEGTKKITITVVPKKTSLVKGKATGNGNVSLSWKKNKTVDGYQIVYSTNKNFRRAVKKKRITNCNTTSIMLSLGKKKTYYFKVRSYKKVGKTIYYGAYSTVKKVKVK